MNRSVPAYLVFSCLLVVGCSSDSTGSSSDTGPDSSGGDGSANPDVAFDVPIGTDAADTSCRAYDASKIDCAKACANFQAWCDTDAAACANPYCGKPSDCTTACTVTKDTTTVTNVLYGCAAENADCSAFGACNATKCKGG